MATARNQPIGYVLYEGPSMLDGSPIVVILTGTGRKGSANEKTGNMLQTYILRRDMLPTEAVKSGADSALCGQCPHRPSTGGACYVNVGQGPQAIYRAWLRGAYPVLLYPETVVRGRVVRIGAYGDPAAAPVGIWADLLQGTAGHTGYTHQWANPQGAALRSLVMASVDSETEALQARALGWRTFRVTVPGAQPGPGEFTCPASSEAGKRSTCAQCQACDGALRGSRKASPVIVVHGSKQRRFIALAVA